MDYKEAKAQLLTARNVATGKPIANNTYLVPRENDAVAVRLHQTDILTFRPDGSVIYNSGGWQTVTTKARMNEYGPARIWSDKGTWKIGLPGAGDVWPGGQIAVYAEGCRVKGARIIGAARDDKAPQKLRAAVGTYVKRYMEILTAGKMEKPGPGDCLICQLAHRGEPAPDRPDPSHIRAHIKERYYVPSLIWAALRSAARVRPCSRLSARCSTRIARNGRLTRGSKSKSPSTARDARMLIAAPELLTALEQCYSDLQRYAPNSAGSIAARDAINKAKGKA